MATFNFTSILCYDTEPPAASAAAPAAAPVVAPAVAPAATPPNASDDVRQFTQKDVNKFMAEERRKTDSRFGQLETSYQDLLQNQNLTTDERDTLQTRYDDLQASQRTTAQQVEFERKTAEEKYQVELKEALKRADHWENKSKEDTVSRALIDAAAGADVFNPEHIVAMLRPDTELKDVDGVLTPMVNFSDIDEKTGASIQTLHTPLSAVKRMRELPEIHGCLFKSNVVQGVGGGQGDSIQHDDTDYANMSTEEYRKNREAIKQRVGIRV